jgi:hypothetical protein
MFVSSDEARSDVILAGAATVFGGVLVGVVLGIPGVPSDGLGGQIVSLVVWFVLSGLTPLLLARYRDDVPDAFGWRRGGPSAAGIAAALAAPVIVLGVVRGLLVDGAPAVALLGRPGRALLGSIGAGPTGNVAGAVVELLGIVVLAVGSLLLLGFLVERGRDAFRADERAAVELLRMIGAGAVGVALLFGVIRGLTGSANLVTVLLNVVALATVLLVADRLVPVGAVISRPAVLTPVVVVVAAHLLGAGGIFRGNLLVGLSNGAFAAGTALAVAVVAGHRGATTFAVPLLVAVHWWPTCLSPLPFLTC